jgi:hypothetical protein
MLKAFGRNFGATILILGAVFVSMMMVRLCDCVRFGGLFGSIVVLSVSFVSSIIGSLALSGKPRWDIGFVIAGIFGGHYLYIYYDYAMLTTKPDMVIIRYSEKLLFIISNSAIAVIGYALGRGIRLGEGE